MLVAAKKNAKAFQIDSLSRFLRHLNLKCFMSSKTVYILGAGFSMDAGAPSQGRIVKEIYGLKGMFKASQNLKIDYWLNEFDKFLSHALNVSDSEKNYYTLEDVYTPIDKCIAENISFKNYTPQNLVELRDHINRLIILAIRNAIDKSSKSKSNIEKFAEFIVKQAQERLIEEKNDLVSIITTNWDIMLDNYIYKLLSDEKKEKGEYFKGVVDYCCYISSLDENDHSIKPGLYALGRKGYNVKLLKLHGSLNWLQCPKCQRLYVKFYKKFNGGYVFDKKYCRHCERNFQQTNEQSNQLGTNIIMPTFLKNLNNIQNKLIWQNSAIEISEAKKLVFIGYSLPLADFEFKQMLSRMTRKDVEIEVYLVPDDDPQNYTGNAIYQTAGYRFQNYFSGRNCKINYGGVKEFVTKNCS